LEPEDLAIRGRQDVISGKINPYQIASKVTSGGAVTPRELGAIVAEHENLARDAIAKGKAATANPTPANKAAYEEARQAAEDFAVNVVKPAGTMWGELGRGLQQTARIDPATEVGLRNAAITRLGRELTASESVKVKQIYDRTVKPSATKADKAMDNLSKKIETKTRGVKTPTEEEMGKLLSEMKEKLTPCR
jgi:hypothetical protein